MDQMLIPSYCLIRDPIWLKLDGAVLFWFLRPKTELKGAWILDLYS